MGLKYLMLMVVFVRLFTFHHLALAQDLVSEEDIIAILDEIKSSSHGSGDKKDKASRLATHRVSIHLQFKSGGSEILEESVGTLSAFGKSLEGESLRPLNFMIIVYSDVRSTGQHHLDLALRRAQSVKNFISTSFLVDGERLKVKGMRAVDRGLKEKRTQHVQVDITTLPK